MRYFNTFITFEGNEGCGKSLQVQKTANYFKDKGEEVLLVREPGGTKIAENIRNIIFEDIKPLTEAYLFASSRNELIQTKILPAVLQNKIVICDRFVDSSIVYQGVGRKLGIDFILKLNYPIVKDCMPFKTIYLDIDPKIGLERIKSNNRDTNRLDKEKISFYEENRKGYLELAKKMPSRFIVINANQSPEKVFKEIKEKVLEPFFSKKDIS